MTKRIVSIDIIKGIGIILVVFGHCSSNLSGKVLEIINSFHMPLFFFCSGLVFSFNSFEDILDKRMTSLGIPLVIYSSINWLVTTVLSLTSIPYKSELINILQLGGLWYLVALFLITLFVTYFFSLIKKRYKCPIVIASLLFFFVFVLGLFLSAQKIETPVYVLNGMVGLGFFWSGFLLKKKFVLLSEQIRKGTAIIQITSLLVSLLLVTLLIVIPGENVQMYRNFYGNALTFCTKAAIGIIAVTALGLAINRNSFLQFIGERTLPILVLHFPIYRLIEKVISHLNVCGGGTSCGLEFNDNGNDAFNCSPSYKITRFIFSRVFRKEKELMLCHFLQIKL